MADGSNFESSTNYNLIASGDNPFLDISQLYFPRNIKDAFPLARTIFYTNGLVRQAIKKLAEYSITDLEFVAPEEGSGMRKDEIQDVYERIFSKQLDIKKFLISVGLDYFVYGNAFVSIYFPFKRMLTCQSCEEQMPITLGEIADWEYTDKGYRGTCPRCKKKVEFTAQDKTIQQEDRMRLIRWNPENIDIEYFPFSGERIYTYDPPEEIRAKILGGDKEAILRTPTLILNVIRDDKVVKLNPHDLFHFIAESPTDEQQEWGKALIICAFKNIFYASVLRKGAEAIALDHIIPLRVLFPQITGSEGFHSTSVRMSKIESKLRYEFTEWRKDKNRVIISPFPMGMQFLGGQGRGLLPTPEIQQATEEIFLSLGLPQGLLMGSAPWAANSIAMRIVENAFLTYRNQLQTILDFVKDRLRDYLDLPDCTVRMKEFKMMDDVQYKQLMMGLAQGRLISKRRLLEMFNIDYSEEMGIVRDEMKDESIFQAEAQGEMIKIQAGMQDEIQASQSASMMEQQSSQMEEVAENFISITQKFIDSGWPMDQAINIVNGVMQQQMQSQMMQAERAKADQARALFMQDRMASTGWSLARAQRQLKMFDVMDQFNPAPTPQQFQNEGQYVNSLVSYLMQLPGDQREAQLSSIKNKDIAFFERLVNYLNGMGMNVGAQDGGSVGGVNPLPQDNAPRRQGY